MRRMLFGAAPGVVMGSLQLAGGAMRAAVADAVPGNEALHLLELRHPGLRQSREVVSTVMQVRLEVPRPAPEPSRDLRQHAQAKCS